MKSGRKITVLLVLMIMLAVVGGNPAALAQEGNTGDNSGGPESAQYVVRAGDCLWSLARKFRVSVSSLARANGLKEDGFLLTGQVLTVPGGKPAVSPGTAEAAISAAEEAAEEARLERFRFWPVTGAVSSLFGPRHGRMHQGLDIAGAEGQPIRSLAAGTVVWAGEGGDYGNVVIINHGNGVRSLYAHAKTLEVASGEHVEQGQIIARVGSTGKSTGPHLHLEIRYRDIPLNPVSYLPCVSTN